MDILVTTKEISMRDKKNGSGLGKGFSLVIIGVVLIAIGLSLGGKWNANRIFPFNGKNENKSWSQRWNRTWSWNWDSDSIRDVQEISGSINRDIRAVKIDLKAASLEISTGDSPSYLASDFEKDTISIEEVSGVLRINEKNWTQRFGSNFTAPVIHLILPEKVILDFFELNMGAGSVKGSSVQSISVELDTGAGSLDFTDSYFERSDINTGAGRVMFSGTLGSRTTISTGAGSVEMKIKGNEDDYRIEFERGLGSVRIGNESMTGMGNGFAGNRNADKEISVSTGVGSVKIDFY